jgi:uncharacterized protein with ATP-grasp and redox domains
VNIYLDCVPCFLRQALEAARNVSDSVQVHERIVREVLRLAAALDLNRSPPVMAQHIHRRLRELTGVEDIFFLFKVKCSVIARHTGLPLGLHVLRSRKEVAARHADPVLAIV